MKKQWILPKLLAVTAMIFLGNLSLKPMLSMLPEALQRVLFTMVIPYGILLPLSFLILRTMKPLSFSQVRPYSFLRLCRTALIMMGVSLPVIGSLTVLKVLFWKAPMPELSGIRSHLGFYLFLLLVFNPLAEELLFRKLIFERLRPLGDRRAIYVSAALFALPHLFSQGLPQMCGTFWLGLVLASVTLETGRLLEGIALHGFFNLYGMFLSLFLAEREAGAFLLVLLNFTVILLGISLLIGKIRKQTGKRAQNPTGKAKIES